MRHGRKFNHLGRKKGHRRALLANMASALIRYKRINTTLAKAKALRQYIEPLVTKAKANTTHARRVVFSYVQDKQAVTELFGPVREKVGDRPGGYVRVIRTGFRQSDGAEMAMIEFVDFNEHYVAPRGGEKVKPGRRRTRRGRKKSTTESAAAVATAVGASEEE
ncbi:MAG: 50S ribosomal protein L17 [Saprospiraceae bacterium]|nr:50S ribosomal protein L17 [Saprospiraceae bacterium]